MSRREPSKNKLPLASGPWGLARAQQAAAQIIARPDLVQLLVQALLSKDEALRMRASDTARRVTEKQPALLEPHAETLIGLLSESSGDNWRTRAHLGLIVARVAHSTSQRLRAAGLLMPLYYDPSNVVRCTAIEGLGLLAQREPSLRSQFEPLAEGALASGTCAMQNRAWHALARLDRGGKKRAQPSARD
jgi:hypothetical protein